MSGKAVVCLDGVVAGLIGAATIAIWFLFMDAVTRLPLYTPSVLGEGFLLREPGVVLNHGEQDSVKLAVMYSGVYGLVFIVLGVLAAYVFCSLREISISG
jgi:hypothetical protein